MNPQELGEELKSMMLSSKCLVVFSKLPCMVYTTIVR
jgi:hypothetical protein